jgi:hypothetical protein
VGWPVNYELIEVLPDEYFYWEAGMQWAEADISEAAAHLRAIRSGSGVAERTLAARLRVASAMSMQALRCNYQRALMPAS